jgi:hypothetical protein
LGYDLTRLIMAFTKIKYLFTEFEIYIKSHLISRTKMNQKEANAKYIDLIYRIQTGQELRKAGVNIFGKSVNSSRTAF